MSELPEAKINAAIASSFIGLTRHVMDSEHVAEAVAYRSTCEGDRVSVSVTDYGVGIPTKHLPHLFERFYRVEQVAFKQCN